MQDGFLRGHGTQVVDGKLMATLCGVIERVNKLVSVRPLSSRYVAELGDVVVGRVADVAGKRWKVDVAAQQAAVLMLSAVNLPGGIQRRRTAEDELNMRQLYGEGDLISAEVQSFYADGAVALHTRSLKYGKLAGGQLVQVQHNLIKRQKQHFVALEALGVDIIFGVNGAVWIAPWAPKPAAADLPPAAQ
jgi:exosome complex component RRP4